MSYKAEGALRFSKQKYYESGNRASRLLAFRLRKSQADRTVFKVNHPTAGRMVSHPKDVANAFASFYKNVYSEMKPSPASDDIEASLASLDIPSLSEEASEQMISPITEIEIRDAIKRLKSNK